VARAREIACALVGCALFTLALGGCGGATMQTFRFGARGESIERCEVTRPPASDAHPAIVSGPYGILGTRARDGLESWGHMLFVSPGGGTLLATRRHRVFHVDVATAALRARYDVGLEPVRLAAITDDGSMLAVVGYSGDEARLRVISTADGRVVIDAPSTTETLRLAPTLPRIVVDDGVWDLATGARLWRAPSDCPRASGDASCTMVPLASGAGVMALRAAAAGRSTVEVTYFDGRAGAHASFDSPIRLHPELDPPIVTTVGRSVRGFLVADPSTPTFAFELDGDVRSLIVAPEAGVAVVETDRRARARELSLRMIDLASGAERFRVPWGIEPARVIAGSLVIRRGGTIERHDLAAGVLRGSVRAWAAVVSRDGWMVANRGEVVDPEGRVRADGAPPREHIEIISRDGEWRMLQDYRVVGDETCVRVVAGYDHAALGASDGRLFISSNRDGAMTTIDLPRAAAIRSVHPSIGGSIFPLPLADAFVFQGAGDEHDDELVVVDASSGEVRRRVQAPRHGYRVVGGDAVPASASEYPGHLWDQHPLEIAGERVIVQLHHGRTIDLWDLTRDRSSDHLAAELEVAQADVSDDGTLLAIGSDEGEVRILRLAPAPLALARLALSSPITALRVAPDGERLAVATRDGRLRVVVIESAEVSAELDFDARHDWVTALTWRGDERLVAFTEREAIVEIGR